MPGRRRPSGFGLHLSASSPFAKLPFYPFDLLSAALASSFRAATRVDRLRRWQRTFRKWRGHIAGFLVTAGTTRPTGPR